jgi:RES domain-containing protein
LSEASSGALLLEKYGTLGFEVVPVVRRMETKFRKPAQGAVHSQASISSEQDAQFVAALTTKGRALVEVGVDLHDEHGAHALSATVEWFVAKR